MTASVAKLVQSSDGLSERERHEAVTEILRRVDGYRCLSLDDEALTRILSMTFEELDARESSDGTGKSDLPMPRTP